jgi:membrane protein
MGVLRLLKVSLSDFLSDNAMTMGAALAFYTALSLSPLLILLLSVASFLGSNMQDQLVRQITSLIGPEAGSIISTIIENAGQQKVAATVSAVIGLATLVFSATGVFAALQSSLNRIWNIEAKPGHGIWNYIRKRLLSLGMILAIGFLLIVSLAVSTTLNIILAGSGMVWQAVNFTVSLAVFILLFALMYKFLPDAEISWKDVWVGAAMTAVLFAIGKFAIGAYLGYSSVGSTYGAAGSLMVLLVWVYYSSLIVFFGAEMTQIYARKYGSRIQPESHAEWIDSGEKREQIDKKKAELEKTT